MSATLLICKEAIGTWTEKSTPRAVR
jgi:hypothetical protein